MNTLPEDVQKKVEERANLIYDAVVNSYSPMFEKKQNILNRHEKCHFISGANFGHSLSQSKINELEKELATCKLLWAADMDYEREEKLAYWKSRCEAAEKVIFNNDIDLEDGIYDSWLSLKNKQQ